MTFCIIFVVQFAFLKMFKERYDFSLQIAQSCKDFTTVGIDLVAMCVNDILAQGAEPLYFLDYFACGKLETETAKIVLGGIAKACAEAGCALLGGILFNNEHWVSS